MKTTRRGFLKMGRMAAAGFALLPVASLLTSAEASTATPEAVPGKRWALAVDLRMCRADEGCKDCIMACHYTHNVPAIADPHEEIKWIWTEPFPEVFPGQDHGPVENDLEKRSLPVLCNHCEHAPCVRVCPTRATFKSADGIVMMDYHRCIGCRYCMAACPYGARSFNFRDPRPHIPTVNPAFPTREKGVVEKCNLCAERLVVGQPPACVAACPHAALVFGDLRDPNSTISQVLRGRYAIRRKVELGTEPKVYYLV